MPCLYARHVLVFHATRYSQPHLFLVDRWKLLAMRIWWSAVFPSQMKVDTSPSSVTWRWIWSTTWLVSGYVIVPMRRLKCASVCIRDLAQQVYRLVVVMTAIRVVQLRGFIVEFVLRETVSRTLTCDQSVSTSLNCSPCLSRNYSRNIVTRYRKPNSAT